MKLVPAVLRVFTLYKRTPIELSWTREVGPHQSLISSLFMGTSSRWTHGVGPSCTLVDYLISL